MIFNIGGKSGGGFAIPTFDGSYAVFGNEKQGYIECYSSGTLTFPKNGTVDVFLLGGGKAGAKASSGGGAGGAGSAGQSAFGVKVDNGAYPVQIGGSGGTSSALGYSSASGGGASGGKGATHNSDSAAGSAGTSYPFGETSGTFYKRYGAGGGGGGWRATVTTTGTMETVSDDYKRPKSGGTLGGGSGGSYSGGDGTAGTANTGSGGGGGGYRYHQYYDEGTGNYVNASGTYGYGGAGGSGIVIVRWGYGAFEIPRFSGNHAVFGTAEKGYIECYSSGTITFKQGGEVDLFLLGSGLSGANGTATNTGTSSTGSGTSYGGKGGSGAVGRTILGYKANKGSYPVTIGETCYSTTEPNATTAFGQTANTVANNGGNGSYTYAEWGTGDSSKNTSTSGTKGSNGTSFPFGESALNADVDPSSIWYKKQLGAGGGGGGARSAGWKYAGGYAGGTYGGGYGGKYSDGVQIDCTPGEANTGSGGGGGGSAAYGDALYQFEGKPGGSGILIVRWGAWTA